MRKISLWISKLFKHPTWSAVIAGLILSSFYAVYAWYTKTTLNDIYIDALKILDLNVKLYFIFSVFGAVLTFQLIIKQFKRRRDLILDEPIGNYSFIELCKILETEKITMRTMMMQWQNRSVPEATLLTQFINLSPIIAQGVDFQHPQGDTYVYALFCPKMVTYGLVDRIEKKISGINAEQYQLSDLGKRFIALFHKYEIREEKRKKRSFIQRIFKIDI
jgi:hypothetical protein